MLPPWMSRKKKRFPTANKHQNNRCSHQNDFVVTTISFANSPTSTAFGAEIVRFAVGRLKFLVFLLNGNFWGILTNRKRKQKNSFFWHMCKHEWMRIKRHRRVSSVVMIICWMALLEVLAMDTLILFY